jgi:S-DNA-T family DNA segregation ATPase FtsK/SpoIIIE
VRYLLRQARLLLNGRYRRRWLRRTRGLLGRAFIARAQKPSRQPRVRAAVAGDAVIETPELWNGVDSSVLPEWEASEAPAPLVESEEIPGAVPPAKSQWQLPSIDLLSPPEPYSVPQTPLQQMARHIENTLAEHGVAVEVKDIKAGPRIVRFGLVPGWVQKKGESNKGDASGAILERSRVKVQSILTREKDLALALKTPYLRIEAPVPGEALVGLEVPNPSPSKVPLRKVMDVSTFQKVVSKGGLPIALGEDTGGNPVVTDLGSLPHMLIAGATGSGKSVCINSIVASLLFTKPPDQLRMLMVDPKRVELTPFNGIPHLIAPVIVDVEEVNPALRALMREMFRRYKQMEEVGTRNIAGYNAKAQERMPYLVLIVDELADLMMSGGFEVEQNLVRLAQLGRATGIHLVLATQRPSVNVVTGLLKANIPARVAFAVASQVDSRVILDAIGAEKLLGKGDMLLLNNDSPKPRRVQGTLVYDEEVDKLVEFWLNQKGPPLPVIPIDDTDEEVEEEDNLDEQMLERARELAIRNPHLSSSFLERRLKIGGSKAAQIIELLEEEGLVIPR